MKNKLYSLMVVLFSCLSFTAKAQNLITVQSSGSEKFYTNIDTALYYASSGDFIYLPGGSFTPQGGVLAINKKVNIIGAGHFADSSLATGQTILNGSIRVRTGADGGFIQGMYVTGSIYFGTGSGDMVVNGYSISRCYVDGSVSLSYNTSITNTSASNINITENVINGYLHIAEGKNVSINKNIFLSNLGSSNGQVVFRNNIFLLHAAGGCHSTPTLSNINGASFYDNIINNTGCDGIYTGTFSGNSFYNNMFSASVSFPLAGNPGSGNIDGQPIDSIYITHTGTVYKEINNYKLRPTCVGKNAGSDGTDIGLYGTSYPYKQGAVPMNPHISKKTIAPQTDGQGNLNINIKVGAQDR